MKFVFCGKFFTVQQDVFKGEQGKKENIFMMKKIDLRVPIFSSRLCFDNDVA